ncbi:undecaprenyldiphospho-muramoylpentapeptide beta-N-acetylglucosaminyltransferase [Ruania zhangjianzhongii]|uniref:undecaprenyldiphospho-muramoylpentapeptide beta-N-acetylglucosaminyltransferase n=1 Tax=Ruania zhangjianzhongii TaxID=2603206 RepID=UPI001F29BAC9|nr:undecaprenyldiphospho-muramoylpentapeptide beta-N-acetylglucosaminyltransferase [Ruania zhangjianzhongii]
MAEVFVLAGGGSAGHVNPMLATAAELRRRRPDAELVLLGTAEGLEAELVPAAGFELTEIEKVPLPRRPSMDALRFPRRWRSATATARAAIEGAAAVVGFGGYVATPAYLAGRSAGVPIVVHEQNARPGLANRLGARWAAAVGITFDGTPLPKARLVGLPLRPAIADLVRDRATDAVARSVAGAQFCGLDPERTTVLVTGGSLGAARLNATIPLVATALVEAGAQVLHLTGKGKSAGVLELLGAAPAQVSAHYHVREYLTEMEQALACADLVISRAGAGMVSELAALGIPAVYVPLPIGNGEQRLNARPVVSAGGGLLVEDSELSSTWLREHLLPLAIDAGLRARMGAEAAGAGITDGAARLADLVLEAGGGPR